MTAPSPEELFIERAAQFRAVSSQLRLRILSLMRALEPCAVSEIADELEVHIEMRAERLIQQGMTPQQAREEAIRRLGGLDEAKKKLTSSARRRARPGLTRRRPTRPSTSGNRGRSRWDLRPRQ